MKTPRCFSIKNRKRNAVKWRKTTSCEELNSTRQTNIQSFFTVFKRPRSLKRGRTPETPPTDNSPIGLETPPSGQVDSPIHTTATPPSSKRQVAVHENQEIVNSKKRQCKSPSKNETQQPQPSTVGVLKQMYLDLGQRDFAKQTICQTCGMLFVHGLSEDAQQHKKICQDFLQGVPLFNATSARVVERRKGGDLIVEIRPSDSYELRQKLKSVNNIVDKDLGFALNGRVVNSARTSYLFVRQKRILGMATVEVINKGYALKTLSERSNESRRAMVGIHKIWVHQKCRKMGIASMLVDVVRSKFVYGLIVPVRMIAFSSPTEAGARFATQYLRSTSDGEERAVLVYDCSV